MNFTDLPTNLPQPVQDGACNHLLNSIIPNISLPTQDDNLLKLNRIDTFRLVIFCYPMTGHPDRPLPKNWNSIPGAIGCTPQHCSFRDNYDKALVDYPFIRSNVQITRLEVWVTNRNNTVENVRNVVALQDLGEVTNLGEPSVTITSGPNSYPDNGNNNLNPDLHDSFVDYVNKIPKLPKKMKEKK